MNKLRYVAFLSIAFTQIHCTQTKPVEVKATPIIITASSKDTVALAGFNLIDSKYNFGYAPENEVVKESVNDTTIRYTIRNRNTPTVFNCIAFGAYGRYQTNILSFPGDSIQFHLENSTFHYPKDKAAQYEFYTALEKDSANAWPHYTNDIMAYKKACKTSYEHRLAFIESYQQQHPHLPLAFETATQIGEKYNYYTNLLNPLIAYPDVQGYFFNTTKGIIAEMKAANDGALPSFQLKEYINDVHIADFQHYNLMNNKEYKSALIAYTKYYFLELPYDHIQPKDIANLETFTKKHYNAEQAAFIMTNAIQEHYNTGKKMAGYSLKYLLPYIDSLKNNTNYEQYASVLVPIHEKLNYQPTIIPDHIQQEKFLSYKGDTLTLQQILAKTADKKVMLDFWASWCLPCIEEIQKGLEARKELTDKDGMEWVYFSIDNNKKAWRDRVASLKKYEVDKNQYLILDPNHSSIKEHFKVVSVPRYIIVSDSLVISDQAPEPSNINKFREVINKPVTIPQVF